ncbi:CD81 protein-like [Acipenser oxyrinchus oxyrinchus]|uniref:Tetraspanin n=1 Tax=Acipenser oxyrinchus oxyrinchus TaxID=40147 RepID=A0AAD8FXJ1_ACIOX|nr:CD81 protein-like [Acipenser oxyrinchus oxyrinchus]
MGVEGCTKCIKYLLFIFNFIFWLAGGVILGVSLWLRHDPQTSELMGLQLDGEQAPSTFYIGVYILITVGAVMMFVGFLGCYGAIQESQCLLGTFFACLVILFACEVAAGIWGFINKDQVTQEMKVFYDSAFSSATVPALFGVAGKEEKRAKAEGVLKVFHETLQCCGTNKVSQVLLQTNGLCPTKDSILEQITQISCHSRIDELFTTKLYLIGIAALVVAFIMIFEMIFSMILCCGIRNSSVY